jgi:hypothetical protein
MDEGEAWYRTRGRGPQPNLSYFAFTATPKSQTLQLFGTWDPEARNPRSRGERGMYVPFHVYSMRQAIEEGFILDVLANYRTYDAHWRSKNAMTEQAEPARLDSANPEVDERDAEARIVRFVALDPTSLRKRAKVIVEDFRDEIAGRLGERAKAMVVCTGRRHLVGTGPATAAAYPDRRCYTPADFRPLLEATGLMLAAACVAGEPIDLGVSHTGHAGLLLTPSCRVERLSRRYGRLIMHSSAAKPLPHRTHQRGRR